MTALPILPSESPRKNHNRRWSIPLHVGRVSLFVAILLLIRHKHANWVAGNLEAEPLSSIGVVDLDVVLPMANQINDWSAFTQSRIVVDDLDRPIARLIQTMPTSRKIIGYLGPTNLLIVVSPKNKILNVQILHSADTVEHVEAIQNSKRFLQGYQGLSWTQPEQWPAIDAVSGATLTSYAILQSVAARAGQEMEPLKFPAEVTRDEISSLFVASNDANLTTETSSPHRGLMAVTFSSNGEDAVTGFLARTSPLSDAIVGYQGPTDTLLAFNPQKRFVNLHIRSSYDNAPYVGYVRDDSYITELLAGKSLNEIAALADEAYEGVSGATMTSLSVWDGVRLTADEISQNLAVDQRTPTILDFLRSFWRDLVTGLICLFGIVIGVTRMRKKRRLRFWFLVLVIVYLGFLRGDMLSQAVIVGWSQNGLPYSIAPGLVLLCIAAFAVPIFSKHNVYCSQLCPLGAIQQVSKSRLGLRLRLPSWLSRLLKQIPTVLIVVVLVVAYKYVDINLASIEAFDAFAFRVAGLATISVAVAAIASSLFIPMAYCRYGCPTGRVLSYLRFNANSGQFRGGDIFLISVFALGLLL